MKNGFTKRFQHFLLAAVLVCVSMAGKAQCPWGYIPDGLAFDTTIMTPAGINSMQIKFPKFDPEEGMVTCVRLCITITGVVDNVSVENNSASPQTADIYYIRTDQITGPALSTPLSNSVNYHYGPYALGATDGIGNSGPDYISITADTVLNATEICRTITDSTDLSQFYGLDSVTYTYDITAFTNVSCTGGNYNSNVATSAFVNFRFEYCYCPAWVLPISVRQFEVTKKSDNQAELMWKGFDEPGVNYRYVIETSSNGRDFEPVSSVEKNTSSQENIYKYLYTNLSENGMRYFRIRQVYSNGYTRFSEIRKVELGAAAAPKFLVYPNPSSGIVGIKFDNISSGRYLVLITNTQGQAVMEKEIEVTGPSFRQIGTLPRGMYWLRITDVTSHLSCVNQLLIK